MTIKNDIRKLLGSEKLILGTDRVLKAVRRGKAARVILASNAPSSVKEQFLRHQQLGAGFSVEDAGVPNDELGTICKKPFSVAAIAILK